MENHSDRCNAALTLEQAGLQKTVQRVAVLDSLIIAQHPLTVREILSNIGDKQKINRVTVYRILTSFREKGIIREIGTDKGGNFYEMACSHNPIHPHFHCRTCSRMICLEPLTLTQVWDWFSRPSPFSIEHISINIGGVCAECLESNTRNSVAHKGGA